MLCLCAPVDRMEGKVKEQKRHQQKHSGPKAERKKLRKQGGSTEQDARKRNPKAFAVQSAVRMAKTFHRSVLHRPCLCTSLPPGLWTRCGTSNSALLISNESNVRTVGSSVISTRACPSQHVALSKSLFLGPSVTPIILIIHHLHTCYKLISFFSNLSLRIPSMISSMK